MFCLLGIAGCVVFASCSKKEQPEPAPSEHEHTYSSEWSKDETNHWHAATCEHTSEVSGRAAHTFDAGSITPAATHTTAGLKTFTCSVCGQTKTEVIAKLTYGTKEAPLKPSEAIEIAKDLSEADLKESIFFVYYIPLSNIYQATNEKFNKKYTGFHLSVISRGRRPRRPV